MNLSEYYKICIAIDPKSFMEVFRSENKPKGLHSYSIVDELKPSDVYCYFYAKFGTPNGLQNFLRNDTSDNLIHWEWVLEYENKYIFIQGMNLRTEVVFLGNWEFSKDLNSGEHINNFIEVIKNDFSKYGKKMSQVRKALEDWDIFVNPYQSLKKSVNQLKEDLDALNLDPLNEKITESGTLKSIVEIKDEWQDLLVKYNRGVGLSMSLNIMAPILAESFINLLFYILCRPDIKDNNRLFDSFIRSNIDVKIQSLHIQCLGFKKAVNWSSNECKNYNDIINRRNDLLHGNINIKELKHSEVFFNRRVPIFKKYRSIWKHSIGTALDHSRLPEIGNDLKVIESFTQYVLSCLEESVRKNIVQSMESPDLGFNKKENRLAVLFPYHIVDAWDPEK